MRRWDEGGYAMLAALVVMTLASAFALAAVGALTGSSAIERSGARVWRDDGATAEALQAVGDRLRWRPGALVGTADGGDVADAAATGGVPWRAQWQPASAPTPDGWQQVQVVTETGDPAAAAGAEASLELRAEPWAAGVVCAGDAAVEAPLLVAGSGVYVGGSVYRRENIGFIETAGTATPTGAPADLVCGEVWPAAAVHAGAGIFSHGEEIHADPAACLWSGDTDEHTGGVEVASFVEPPGADFAAAASQHAIPLGDAWHEGRLQLDLLESPPHDVESAESGLCVLAPPHEVTEISGEPPADMDSRLLIVVPGDAVVGTNGETTTLTGSLVVCGGLHVEGELRVTGAVYSERLTVDAPVRVTVPPGWRDCVLCGACKPVISEVGM